MLCISTSSWVLLITYTLYLITICIYHLTIQKTVVDSGIQTADLLYEKQLRKPLNHAALIFIINLFFSDSSEEPHHAHYSHHGHFLQDLGLPNYRDPIQKWTKSPKSPKWPKSPKSPNWAKSPNPVSKSACSALFCDTPTR